MVFHRNPNLSDDWDLERLFFLFSDEDPEWLLFRPLSGEEEADRERDLFLDDEEPLRDLELDLFVEDMSEYVISKSLYELKSSPYRSITRDHCSYSHLDMPHISTKALKY